MTKKHGYYLHFCIIINSLKRYHSKIKFFHMFFICQNPHCFCWYPADESDAFTTPEPFTLALDNETLHFQHLNASCIYSQLCHLLVDEPYACSMAPSRCGGE